MRQYFLADVDILSVFGQNFLCKIAGPGGCQTSSTPTTLGEFISNTLPQVYTVALILVFIYLIWGGYRYMISGGDSKAVQSAKAHLTWAVIGMIVIYISYWLFQILNSLLFKVFQGV